MTSLPEAPLHSLHAVPSQSLIHSRYSTLASNTIDYWMTPDQPDLRQEELLQAIAAAPVLEDASLQLYIHVPFCAQRCRFCAFSGGNQLPQKVTERYSELLIWQLQDLWGRTQIKGYPIRSVHIGGGSPDLLGASIGPLLRAIHDLDGFSSAKTELSVELTLATTSQVFLDALVEHQVSKVSFGIQTLQPRIRKSLRLPKQMSHLGRVLGGLKGQIGIVNADLMTSLPGQRLQDVHADLRTLTQHPQINALSTYLLTPGAAPSLIAGWRTGELAPQASVSEQACMRLHSYTTLLRAGWQRKGTNTYVDSSRISGDALDRISGNECIGSSHYEAFLLGVGPQAVSAMPGVRAENIVDLQEWCAQAERGEQPFFLPKCSLAHQRDQALWVFPLRHEGLPMERYQRMLQEGALSPEQQQTLQETIDEGLITQTDEGFALTILGEVFMGHLVRDLKSHEARAVLDAYINEGFALGAYIADGHAKDRNEINDRQRLADAS